VTFNRSVVSSTNKTYCHDITELLLKVALKTINQPNHLLLLLFGTKLKTGSMNLAFIPVFKPHTHKLYILRHCTNIVYIYMTIIDCLMSIFFKIYSKRHMFLLLFNSKYTFFLINFVICNKKFL
jgi:hypothetical protein